MFDTVQFYKLYCELTTINREEYMSDPLDERLDMRISSDAKAKLLEKCEEYETTYPVLMREIINALIQNRVRIITPKSTNLKSKLYVN